MEADEELERVMLTLSPSKLLPHYGNNNTCKESVYTNVSQ